MSSPFPALGTITVSAAASSARPNSVDNTKFFTWTGGGSIAQTWNPYHSTSSSGRSRPNTSQATASSKGLVPLPTATATLWGTPAAVIGRILVLGGIPADGGRNGPSA